MINGKNNKVLVFSIVIVFAIAELLQYVFHITCRVILCVLLGVAATLAINIARSFCGEVRPRNCNCDLTHNDTVSEYFAKKMFTVYLLILLII